MLGTKSSPGQRQDKYYESIGGGRLINIKTLAAVIAAACMALGARLAQAQELGEIVVTAQKRSENMQNVPISVTAVISTGKH